MVKETLNTKKISIIIPGSINLVNDGYKSEMTYKRWSVIKKKVPSLTQIKL